MPTTTMRRPSITQTPTTTSTTSSDSTSTVRVPSPLAGNPLASAIEGETTLPANRPRGHSTSTIRDHTPSRSTSPLSRVTSNPVPPSYSASIADSLSTNTRYLEDRSASSFRQRSRSKSPGQQLFDGDFVSSTALGTTPSSWWNNQEETRRPWKDSPKREKTIPTEQVEGWEHTRIRVAQAARSVLGTATDVTHEVLKFSVDFLDFAPVPGLQSAARTLLMIWDSVELIDMNRLQCLRLTERCAEILLSVRMEIRDAGDAVGEELTLPISKLNEAFVEVYQFLQKQAHRPWLKRYLRREEITRQISGCDAALHDALSMFSLSIQIRILKQVQASDRKRQAETQVILDSIVKMSRASATTIGASANALQLSGIDRDEGLPASISSNVLSASTSTITPAALDTPTPTRPPAHLSPVLGSPTLPASVPSPSLVLPILQNLRNKQNEQDATRDMADLRNLMKEALGAGSDAEMLTILGVTRDEMPEAIKTLQRALERVVEKEGSSSGSSAVPEVELVIVDASPPPPTKGGLTKMVRRISMQSNAPVLRGQLKRSKTASSQAPTNSSSEGKGPKAKDTLDREFIESGIDALRRMSQDIDGLSLPSWTITRYEVDREQKIGIGFFSDVYKGSWRGHTVAIKVLAESTPRKLFVREIEIWKALRHPNVLELYGASSASSDPPWFFVSPYEKNGSLVEYLRKIVASGSMTVAAEGRNRTASFPGSALHPSPSIGAGRGSEPALGPASVFGGSRGRRTSGTSSAMANIAGPVAKEWDLLRFMHEIARGMEYLHGNGILHGDLKAANVLVDDRLHCVISDFGQSEMKSEAYRISGTMPPHGTLRWQAPELMAGNSQLTTEMDVYAFAITCIEVLSMGRLPWPLMDDDAVRHFVLRENNRPTIPPSRFSTPALQEIIRQCWANDPFHRPIFSRVAMELKQLRKGGEEEVLSPRQEEWSSYEMIASRPSPDMHPIGLPFVSPNELGPLDHGGSPSSADSFRTARDLSQSPPRTSVLSQDGGTTTHLHMPEPVPYTPSMPPSSRASSLFASTPSTQSEENLVASLEYGGYDSPPPADERLADIRNERRYRLLLSHDFHPSLTLPLWTPSPVALGAVGYLSKPRGCFVTLFNSFSPEKSLDGAAKALPSLHGYGKVSTGAQRQDKRNAALRGLDAISGLLPFNKESQRRYSVPLRSGHKMAFMVTESTLYRYVERLDVPKRWFQANVDAVLGIYGAEHRIQKEDLHLVIGTLDTPDYALFVSHAHPDGQAHFNVSAAPRPNQPWGVFETDTEVPSVIGGPVYREAPSCTRVCADKVSTRGVGWETVLLAKLRFKPDVAEPTSL